MQRREQNNGAEKRTNGAEKRTNSAAKRTNGAEKRTLLQLPDSRLAPGTYIIFVMLTASLIFNLSPNSKQGK